VHCILVCARVVWWRWWNYNVLVLALLSVTGTRQRPKALGTVVAKSEYRWVAQMVLQSNYFECHFGFMHSAQGFDSNERK
jgi:hypothetical protein